MKAKDISLNIAVNLGRIARWSQEGKNVRVLQFLQETEEYLKLLEKTDKNPKFLPTFNSFKKQFEVLRNNTKQDIYWAEDILTWANILTHRAKLA